MLLLLAIFLSQFDKTAATLYVESAVHFTFTVGAICVADVAVVVGLDRVVVAASVSDGWVRAIDFWSVQQRIQVTRLHFFWGNQPTQIGQGGVNGK